MTDTITQADIDSGLQEAIDKGHIQRSIDPQTGEERFSLTDAGRDEAHTILQEIGMPPAPEDRIGQLAGVVAELGKLVHILLGRTIPGSPAERAQIWELKNMAVHASAQVERAESLAKEQ